MPLTWEKVQAKLTEITAKLAEVELVANARPSRLEMLGTIQTLEDQLAALQLHWSTAKPTVPGWYWYRPVGLPMRPKELFDYNGRLFVRGFEWLDTITNGEWAGPLVPPKEET